MYQRTWSCPASSARWPAGKPRVLIEDDSEVAAVSDHSLFREGGFEVAVCSGPDGSTGCPLVEEGVCALAEGADVVLFGLDVDEPGGRAVLHAHLQRHPDVPVVALRRYAGDDADADDADAGAPDPASIVLPATTSVAGQTRALRRAMWRGHGS